MSNRAVNACFADCQLISAGYSMWVMPSAPRQLCLACRATRVGSAFSRRLCFQADPTRATFSMRRRNKIIRGIALRKVCLQFRKRSPRRHCGHDELEHSPWIKDSDSGLRGQNQFEGICRLLNS